MSTPTKQPKAQQATANAQIAALFGVNQDTTNQWRYERGLEFIESQCTRHSYVDSFAQELEASKAFWGWFMYEWDKFNIRFNVLYIDFIKQWLELGNLTAKNTLRKLYKADVTEWLNGADMAHAYGNFIGEYIKTVVTEKVRR